MSWYSSLSHRLVHVSWRVIDIVEEEKPRSCVKIFNRGLISIHVYCLLRGCIASCITCEIGFPQYHPTPLYDDNTSAIQIATNPIFHEKTKHIEVKCHYIWEVVYKGFLTFPHVSSDLQIADSFTKSMARQCHQFLVDKLMLLDPPTSIWGRGDVTMMEI